MAWQIILMIVIASAGLLYIIGLIKKILIVALGLAVVAGLFLTFKLGYSMRDAQVQAQIRKVEQQRATTIAEITAANEARAKEDASVIAKLRSQIDATPANTHTALPRASVGRVRVIQ